MKQKPLTKKDIYQAELFTDELSTEVLLKRDVLVALALAKKKFWEFEKRRLLGKKWGTSPDKILDECFQIK